MYASIKFVLQITVIATFGFRTDKLKLLS